MSGIDGCRDTERSLAAAEAAPASAPSEPGELTQSTSRPSGTVRPMLVHAALTESARSHAARTALVGSPGIHYDELDISTTALAHHLRAAHTAVGDRVAMWLPKGNDCAFAIFGALKAGCTYVPLDAAQPVERARIVLADAEPVALITDAARFDLLRAAGLPTSVRQVFLTDERRARTIGDVQVRPLADALVPPMGAPCELPNITLQDVAAILYTSGSTGIPKGVKISHGNLANFIGWTHAEMSFEPTDVFCNHASFNFDLSTFDLFASVRAAAALWIVPDDVARSVPDLAQGLKRHRVSVIYAVPSILSLLVASKTLSRAVTNRLRYVLFAGEVYPIARLRELKTLLRDETGLYNLYGPTETNVCTYYRVRTIAPERTSPVPIGRPIAGTYVTIVGDDGMPREDGPVGELFVQGACVTPGYFRRADDRNTANHLRGVHATGDLVSWEAGELVYRGRKDRMIKVAGFRVELGEVEAALSTHPLIAEVGVVAKGQGAETRLHAFYAARDGERAPSLIELKSHAARLLPRYMVPHSAVSLPRLPKNANGKIDYQALAAAVA